MASSEVILRSLTEKANYRKQNPLARAFRGGCPWFTYDKRFSRNQSCAGKLVA
jgi:hypothetical protein